MQRVIALLVLMIVIIPVPASCGDGVQSARSITVYYLEFPPYYYTGHDRQPEGFLLERARQIFLAADIQPTFEPLPAKRIMNRIKMETPCASIGWFKTPKRENYARFSKGIYKNEPLQILYLKKNSLKFDEQTTSAEIFGDSHLTVGLLDGYSYGAVVDARIAIRKPKQVRVVGGFPQLLRMLLAERFSYCIVAPEEIDMLIGSNNLDPALFEHKRLDDMPAGNVRHLMFSSGVPPEIVDQVNSAIDSLTE